MGGEETGVYVWAGKWVGRKGSEGGGDIKIRDWCFGENK